MKSKRLFIQTIGCQMNVYDSDRIESELAALNYLRTQRLADADMVIVNTCAIRAKAEQKVFSFLGRLAGMKRRKPALLIGVGGCVAQQLGERILERAPYLDLVFGTHAIGRLADMVADLERKPGPVVDVREATRSESGKPILPALPTRDVCRFVTIMQGCDNYCSYCVVPYVRGRETSRPPQEIVAEIRALVDAGVREITLLGQNVNSYGQKEGLCSFAELLAQVDAVEGLARIRFTTSHPKDLSRELCCAFRDLDKLCGHIHLPVQSGSNSILRRMNRKYTRERYLERVHTLRRIYPEIAITTDFIVGFPGETRTDFQQTLELIETVGFDSVFAFQYSDRPHTPASRFPEKVSDSEKKRRLWELLELQKQITLDKHRSMIGSIREVLVEGRSKGRGPSDNTRPELCDAPPQWTGRTSGHHIVNFSPDPNAAAFNGDLTGRLVQIKIEHAYAHSLGGTPIKRDRAYANAKGDEFYAA
jgi:tRNA-2-methylthio-N6-dimethylallyladenosine synthase